MLESRESVGVLPPDHGAGAAAGEAGKPGLSRLGSGAQQRLYGGALFLELVDGEVDLGAAEVIDGQAVDDFQLVAVAVDGEGADEARLHAVAAIGADAEAVPIAGMGRFQDGID